MANVVIGVAVSAGLGLLSSALSPSKRVTEETGKLDDLSVRKVGQGWGLDRVYGKYKVTGCPIFWALPRIDRPSTTSSSSGGKGNRTTTTTTAHVYYGTFAVAIGDGTISEVKQIEFNDQIWYNAEGALSSTIENNEYKLANNLEIYLGTSTQSPSPTISAHEDSTRCYFRNMSYIVIKDLPLAEFGNDLPATINITVQGTENNLNTILLDVGKRVGLEPNVDLIAGTVGNIDVTGAKLKQDGSGVRSFVDELTQRWFVSSFIDDNGAINFIRQENTDTPLAIDYEDLGAMSFGGEPSKPYQETITNPKELPAEVGLSYLNVNDNFSGGSVSRTKNRVSRIGYYNPVSLNSSLALTPDMAAEYCYKYLNLAYDQSHQFSFSFLYETAKDIQPRDVFTVPLHPGDAPITIQATEVQIGADLTVEVKGYPYAGENFTGKASIPRSATVTYGGSVIPLSANITTPPVIKNGATTYVEGTNYSVNYATGVVTVITGISPGTVLTITYESESNEVIDDYNPAAELPYYGEPIVTILDINRANDADSPSLYLAIAPDPSVSESFGDTDIYSRLNGGTYSPVTSAIVPTTQGALGGSLPLATGLDTANSVSVTLARGMLDTLTTPEFDNNEQLLLIGDEQIVVKTATLTSPLTYTISNFKRGFNGTTPAAHSSGARVIVLRGDRPVTAIAGDASFIGKTLDIKAVPVGSSLSAIARTSTLNPIAGNYFKPYAPSGGSATKDQGNNITISWTANNTGLLPLSPLSFDVDIMNGASVVRTLSSAVASVVYPVAQQITDFGSAIAGTISVRVYQKSAETGRGYVYSATLTPSVVPVVPTVTAFSPVQGNTGTVVTINGSGFTGASAVKIGTVAFASYTVVNDTTITATVAAATSSGAVNVTGSAGTGASLAQFTIVAPSLPTDSINTSNFSAISAKYPCDTTGASFTATLPASPLGNMEIWFFDANAAGSFGTNPLTIDGNGKTIAGRDQLLLNNDHDCVIIQYLAGTDNWAIIGSQTSLLGGTGTSSGASSGGSTVSTANIYIAATTNWGSIPLIDRPTWEFTGAFGEVGEAVSYATFESHNLANPSDTWQVENPLQPGFRALNSLASAASYANANLSNTSTAILFMKPGLYSQNASFNCAIEIHGANNNDDIGDFDDLTESVIFYQQHNYPAQDNKLQVVTVANRLTLNGVNQSKLSNIHFWSAVDYDNWNSTTIASQLTAFFANPAYTAFDSNGLFKPVNPLPKITVNQSSLRLSGLITMGAHCPSSIPDILTKGGSYAGGCISLIDSTIEIESMRIRGNSRWIFPSSINDTVNSRTVPIINDTFDGFAKCDSDGTLNSSGTHRVAVGHSRVFISFQGDCKIAFPGQENLVVSGVGDREKGHDRNSIRLEAVGNSLYGSTDTNPFTLATVTPNAYFQGSDNIGTVGATTFYSSAKAPSIYSFFDMPFARSSLTATDEFTIWSRFGSVSTPGFRGVFGSVVSITDCDNSTIAYGKTIGITFFDSAFGIALDKNRSQYTDTIWTKQKPSGSTSREPSNIETDLNLLSTKFVRKFYVNSSCSDTGYYNGTTFDNFAIADNYTW